jgi:hypothetical protein
MTRFFVALFMLMIPFAAQAQTDSTVHVKIVHGDTSFHPKKEIIIKGRRYRVYNSWMNIGPGEGFNSNLALPQNILNVDLNIRIYKDYYQLGTFLGGDRFGSYNTYNAHLAYGRRITDERRNMFLCLGPSYSWGYPFKQGIYLPYIYTVFGLYAQAQYIFKLTYDIGIGLSAFADVNSRQTVTGLSLELYLSSAYRGERKKAAAWDE